VPAERPYFDKDTMNHYSDIWYKSSENLRLYARDYGNDSAELTLLCMHGLTRNSADFEELCDALLHNYRLVVPDQRGRGYSDYDPNPTNYHPGTYAQDMFILIDQLKLNNLVLIGTSLGGLMAMGMNAMRPGIFRGVILNDIGPVVESAGLERIKSYVGKTEPARTWQEAVATAKLINGAAFPDYTDADWGRFAARVYELATDGSPHLRYDPAIAQPMAADDTNAVPADLWPLFEALAKVPTLVVRGALSDILGAATVTEINRRKPDLQTVEVPRVGHAPTLSEPEAFSALDSFLSHLKKIPECGGCDSN
jgi:pimeloyl-ACP methyl ester carboxylesterase